MTCNLFCQKVHSLNREVIIFFNLKYIYIINLNLIFIT